jgi:hypothetical protein
MDKDFEKLELPSGKVVMRYTGEIKNKHTIEAGRMAKDNPEIVTFAFMAVLLRNEDGGRFAVEDILDWPMTDSPAIMELYPGVFS